MITTADPEQITRWEARDGTIQSQYGTTSYGEWCDKEALRWCATGRRAHARVAGGLCALFKGEQPLLITIRDNTGFPACEDTLP